MSKLSTNEIIPVTGTTVTLGESGDTISVPSGATIANNGTATGFLPAAGTSGNVLTSDGTNWASGAAGGGAYKVVASGSLSGVTQYVYTGLTKTTTFHFEDVLGTVANHGLQFHLSTDNGSSYDTSSNYKRVFTRVDAGNTTWSANTSDLSQYILYSPCSTANSFRADCTIFNPAGTQFTKIRSQGEGIEGNNQHAASLYSVGVHKVATAVNAVKFHMGSGNFTATYVVTEFN